MEDYVLVPREPTAAMLEAAYKSHPIFELHRPASWNEILAPIRSAWIAMLDKKDVCPENCDGTDGVGSACPTCNGTMLSASPQLQSPMRGGDEDLETKWRVYQAIAGAALGGTDHVDRIAAENPPTGWNCTDAWKAAFAKHRADMDATIEACLAPSRKRIAELEAALSPSPVVSSIPMGVKDEMVEEKIRAAYDDCISCVVNPLMADLLNEGDGPWELQQRLKTALELRKNIAISTTEKKEGT